jgi:adenosine kinase
MQASKIALVVIENPLLDITVQDNDDVIHKKHGLEHGQASLVTSENIGIHDELFARDDKEITTGGAALNSARACNHVLRKAEFDGDVAFVGCIGNDESGKILQKCLEDVKMHGVFAHTTEEATGRCAVVVHGKERTLCANIGASQKYPTSHFEEH